MSTIEDRLDRLESLVEQQQETIEDQQETIRKQRERIADLEADKSDGDENTDDPEREEADDPQPTAVNRRTALKAGGLLAALGVGATATASADPSGQIGTSSAPLEALYTDELYGNEGTVTVQDTLDLNGNNLTSTSVGTDISTDVDSTVTGEEDFALEIEDASGTKPTVRWRRESNTDNALVVQTDDGVTTKNRLLLGDNGNLNIYGNASVTGGPLSVTGGGASITGGNLDMGAANAVELNTDDLGGDYSRPTQGHLLFGMADDDAALLLGEAGTGGSNDGQFVIRTQDDGDEEILLQQHNSAVNNPPVTQLRIDEGGNVRINNDLLTEGGTTLWDGTSIPQGRLQNDSLTVAGNSVSLGRSTGISYVDLGDTGSSFPIPNADIANSSLTVTAGAGLTGGGSVSLGGTTSVSAATTEADVASTFTESDVTVSTSGDARVANGAITVSGSTTVDRSDDDDSVDTISSKQGLRFTPKLPLSEIKLTVSRNTSGESTVAITDTSFNELASASSPGAEDSTTLSVDLDAGTDYFAVVDGSNYTEGYYYDGTDLFPITNPVLDITAGVGEGLNETNDQYNAKGIASLTASRGVGSATVEWAEPSSVSRWDTAAYEATRSGGDIEVYVQTSGDGGSTWNDWDPDGDGTAEPIAPGTDLSSIPPGDRVRFRTELVEDPSSPTRLTNLLRQWRR